MVVQYSTDTGGDPYYTTVGPYMDFAGTDLDYFELEMMYLNLEYFEKYFELRLVAV